MVGLYIGQSFVLDVVGHHAVGYSPPILTVVIRSVFILQLISLAWFRSVRYHAATVGLALGLFLFFIGQFGRQLVR